MKRRIWLHIVVLCALLPLRPALPGTPVQAQPVVLHVMPGGLDIGPCDSWANACSLSYALGLAVPDQEIWVAAGIHTPGTNREDTFQLKNGVALYGGFAGTETALEQRDWVVNPTVLSGDIGTLGDPADNVYHVVTASSVDATAVLDGFTVTGGYADDSTFPDGDGAGMLIDAASPSVRHVTFSDNYALNWGGGLLNYHGGSPALTDVIFSGNTADAKGGGMYNDGNPTLTDVTFEANSAGEVGGGLLNDGGSPMLTEVAFSGNSATWGGGLHSSGSGSPTLTGATFTANPASFGGAIYNSADLTLNDALISDHIVDDTGGGIYNDGHVELLNVILSNNRAAVRGGGIFNALGPAGLNGWQLTFKGNTADSGGGLHNEGGQVELYTSAFSGNIAATGGGLANINGDVKLYHTTVTGNFATADGGGLYTAGGAGHTTLHDSTVDNNDAGVDGGGAYSSGWLTLVNSTVSSNDAAGYGGGIRTAGIWTGLHNVTITANQADNNLDGTGDGGGLYFEGGTVAISNTIIAANQDSLVGDVHPDYACTFAGEWSFSVEYSLFGDGTGCLELIDIGPGNQAGDSSTPLNPLLLRLGANGGETRTHALRFDSPARDSGDPDGCKDQFGTILPSDQRGAARSRDGDGDGQAVCDVGAFEAGGANDAWTRAVDLTLSGGTAQMTEYVDMLGQSRWYKFPVQPGSLVTVELWPPSANLDIALFGDIQAVYDSLTAPAGTQDLVKLNAQFAGDAFNEDAYATDALSPDAHSTAAYSPFAYSPFAYSPFAYSPFAYSPFAYSPFAYSPFAYSPFAYSPFAYSPFAYSPFAYSPFAYSPDPAYSSAQMQSLIAVSAFEGDASELITVNTWAHTGDYYIRVSGRNGTFDVSNPFLLEVTQEAGVCEGVTAALSGDRLQPVAGSYEALILVDWSRFSSGDPDLVDLQTKLGQLAAQVGGVVVDVSGDGYVQAANLQADDHPECPYAKNLVALAIRDIVRAYREAGNPLQYVVLVGDDDVIPFFRYPDRAMLAHEGRYDPPVAGDTASFASLTLGYVLSQDAYGSSLDLSLKDISLPFPDLPVGRLVETATDIIPVLDAYLASSSVTPVSALVTGYDFLADAAVAIQAELEAGLGAGAATLISPAEISPLDRDGTPPGEAAWPAAMLDDLLLGSRHDLVFLAGHFNAQGALAADYETRLWASDLASSAVDLANAVIYSAGCHSGYNVVNEHGIPDLTIQPDWAQAFARKGATFIGGTGYQYGDTDFIEFGERLYLNFTQQLRCSGQPMPVGRALVEAKQAYLAGTAQMRGIDEKTLLQTTLYGLPMLEVTGLSDNGCPSDPGSVVPLPLNGSTRDPGLTLDLRYSDDVTVASSLAAHPVTLNCYDGDDPACPTLDATYYSGSNGTVTNPSEPILPLERRNVSVDGVVLRGVGFRGGHYTDLVDVVPLTGAATTEIRAARAPFVTDVFYPIQPWSVNYFDALADPANGITWLDVIPAQFLSAEDDPWSGTLRLFDGMTFRLFYSANTADYGGNVPALATAPNIQRVTSSVAGGTVTFRARVAGDLAAGVQEVWVTYTTCDAGGTCDGEWRSLDLEQNLVEDTTLWEGDLTLDGAGAEEIRYIVQAVNGVGLVAAATNLGEYFRVGIDPADPSASADPSAPPPAPTTLELQSHAASGAYSTEETFTAQLTSDGDFLAGQKIQFALGAQERWGTTDAEGYAEVTIPLLGPPGDHLLLASFAGNIEYRASSAVASFTIQKQGTHLQLSAQTNEADYGIDAVLVAKLTDAADRPLREKTLGFVVDLDSDGTADYALTGITDLTGQVLLGPPSLPQGDYTIRAYFGLNVTLPSGGSLQLSDVNYEGAQAERVVGTAPALSDITIDQSLIPMGTSLVPSASFTDPDPAAALRAVWNWGDGSTSPGVVNGTDGTVSGSHLYTTPGVYTLRLLLADQSGAYDEAVYRYVVVYDPSGGFVTGGGWIMSPEGAYAADPTLTGKANFGFVSKYKKGASVPTGTTEFQFKAGGLNFHSDSYQWLVVAGAKAMFKGTGTINGGGNYGFLISAIDAALTPSTDVDLFRIKIWDKDAGDFVVYDNQMGDNEDAEPTTQIGGGSIVIHKAK